MAKLARKNGATSVILRVKILDSSSSTGAGKTGLDHSSAGLIIATIASNEATTTRYRASSSELETISTLGTFAAPTSGKARFKEVDSTNHPGLYELQLADARFAVANARTLIVSLSGASGMVPIDLEIDLDAQVDAVKISGSTDTADNLEYEFGSTGYVCCHITQKGARTYYTASADSNAGRGDALENAQSAATGGCIYVRPVYATVTTPLGKDGVDWDFDHSTVTANNLEVWRDYDGVGTTSSMKFDVTGTGRFIATGNDTFPTVGIYDTNSVVSMEGLLAHNQSTGNGVCLSIGDGRTTFRFNRIRSDKYDAILYAGGRMHVESDFIEGGDNAIEIADALLGATLENLTVICHNTMDGGFNTSIPSATIIDTVGTLKSLTVKAGRIKAPSSTGIAIKLDQAGSTTASYIQSDCIEGQVKLGAGYHTLANSLVNSTAFAIPSLDISGSSSVTTNDVVLQTKSSETNSVYSATAKNLNVTGGLAANKATHANVTPVYVDGMDWARLSNKTTTHNLSGTTIKDATDLPASVLAATNGSDTVGEQLQNMDAPISDLDVGSAADIATEPVHTSRVFVLVPMAGGLTMRSEDRKTIIAGSPGSTYAVDFRNDAGGGQKVSTVSSATIISGAEGGVTFGTFYRNGGTQAQFRMVGVTADEYTIRVEGTYVGGATFRGDILVKVVN